MEIPRIFKGSIFSRPPQAPGRRTNPVDETKAIDSDSQGQGESYQGSLPDEEDGGGFEQGGGKQGQKQGRELAEELHRALEELEDVEGDEPKK